MANRTVRHVAGVGVAIVAGDCRIIGRDRMVLNLVALARRMTNLAAGIGLVLGRTGALGIDNNGIVTVRTG